MKPFILASTFARGGSKGLPGKNIKELCGKPLIGYAIDVALQIEAIDEVIVSTDDKEIANISQQCGAKVPFMRPEDLAEDDTSEILAWKHAVSYYADQGQPVDILVSVPATAPLRIADDVRKCLNELLKTDADVVMTMSRAHRNPYFNMIEFDDKGYAHLSKTLDCSIGQRQRAPQVYDLTTVAYAVRVPFLMQAQSLFEGRVRAIEVPVERALDIDSLFDFELAEFLLQRKGLE